MKISIIILEIFIILCLCVIVSKILSNVLEHFLKISYFTWLFLEYFPKIIQNFVQKLFLKCDVLWEKVFI